MIASKLHNDIFVKKVSNIIDLFKWDNVLEQDFPQLPPESIVLNDTLVKQYIGFQDEAYMHHATIARKYGKIYCAYTIHDYDEDASGMYTNLSISDDGGITWYEQTIMPQMSAMAVYGTYPAQWSYPSIFLNLPSGLYLLINTTDGIISGVYQSLGSLVRKINADNTFGDLLWVNNGQGNDSRIVPTPISGYPSYAFADESLINEVITYISQPMFRPKILFGWQEIWKTQETGYYTGDQLREPTEIRPYNYSKNEVLKVWKSGTLDYNIIQNGEDNTTQIISDIPNYRTSPARRFYNYSPEIIIAVGHSKKPNREELMLFVARKDNTTGIYHIANDDVYSISSITKSAPVYIGQYKEGGEQLPFINRVGKDLLDVAFSVSKEEIYFKTIDVSKLI